jgi:hypothetical protein
MNKSTNQNERRGFLSKMLVAGASSVALFSSSVHAAGRTSSSTTTKLTAKQKDELFFIYQEEKLARDVYITLGKLYPKENTFASIQLSEQRHIDAAQGLCEKYGIDISEVNEDEVGNFVLPVLQGYYDDLVEQGSESLLDALDVGVFIEELDIGDLTHAIEDLGFPADVISVYENLREGSYNHLESFNGAITIASS